MGHLFQNGEYLPVKVFVAPEMIQVEQDTYWRKQLAKSGIRTGFWRGIAVGVFLPVVVLVMVRVFAVL